MKKPLLKRRAVRGPHVSAARPAVSAPTMAPKRHPDTTTAPPASASKPRSPATAARDVFRTPRWYPAAHVQPPSTHLLCYVSRHKHVHKHRLPAGHEGGFLGIAALPSLLVPDAPSARFLHIFIVENVACPCHS